MQKISPVLRSFTLTLCIASFTASACAQTQPGTRQPEFQPQIGQEGKDVIWVPTHRDMVEKMLDMAKVTPKDFLIDLGSGDGRTVIAAAKRGTKALGIEYNRDMVELSRRNAAKEGVSTRANFVTGDLFEADLSQATVITLFLLPEINIELRPKILDLRPGTRIVSNTFTMGEWTADATAEVKNDCASYCTALLWIVPAQVEGTWQMADGGLTLKQSFQMLSGTLKTAKRTEPISDAKMIGAEIVFTAGARKYTGRVDGNVMQGKTDTGAAWKATRADRG